MSQALAKGDLDGLPNAAKRHLKGLTAASHASTLTWEELKKPMQDRAMHRRTLVLRVEELMVQSGLSLSHCIDHLIGSINAGTEKGLGVMNAAAELAQTSKGKKAPHKARLYDWVKRFRAMGVMGLVDAHKGRQREFYGWETQALKYWLQPTRPKAAIIAGWLEEEGWASATASRVQYFFKHLPETLNKEAPQRQGPHHYHQNHKPYVIRDNTVLPVGLIYTGDGHTCDVYIAHPVTGKPWRAEFTPWLDLRSHYPVGWYVSEAESGVNTLFSLSQAIVEHDHVPAAIYVDPGSGFKNRMMNNETTGFYARMGIEPLLALPGNARGKGLIEGFFNHFEEYVGKKFPTYCGHCRTDDELRALRGKVDKGTIKLPSFAEYFDAISNYMERYKTKHQDGLGCAPADLWAELERTALEMPAEAIIRPFMERTVQNWRVRLFNRRYQGDALKDYEGKLVMVQYNLHDLRQVAVFDLEHRWVCDAAIVNPVAAQTQSRIEELQQHRALKQKERHLRHIKEIEDRARPVISPEERIKTLTDIIEYTRLDTTEDDFNAKDCLFLGNESEEEATPKLNFRDCLD
ncbi:MAG: Mu transposase C-terminal domain-containing protein [Methylovulum miyakonense]|uniref:Mu transposase C-terminal domain-containing protein n=1 Tax=Methylovulum miyakonense TaxID=645578 RepID=UPI003BB6A10B